MAPSEPPELARCHEHGLVLMERPDSAHHSMCLACEFEDADLKLDDDLPQGGPDQIEFTTRLQWETALDLIPLMQEYLEDKDKGPLWVTHVPWEGKLPAGYSEQERFIPVIGYEWDAREKYITEDSAAKATVATLREEGYGDAQEGE